MQRREDRREDADDDDRGADHGGRVAREAVPVLVGVGEPDAGRSGWSGRARPSAAPPDANARIDEADEQVDERG